MSSCCHTEQQTQQTTQTPLKKILRFDWLLWGSLSLIIASFGLYYFSRPDQLPDWLFHFSHSSVDLMLKMWWGLALGMIAVGLMNKIPREYVLAAMGPRNGTKGLLRAVVLGLALDLCNHGILLVGMKLYERGTSLGQTLAFLIASPWNSLSLTLVLWALIGWKWTLAFILLSAVLAFTSGLIFQALVARKTLPANPNAKDLPEDFHFFSNAWTDLKKTSFNGQFFKSWLIDGITGSQMILRWLLFGVLLAALIQTFVATDVLQSYFGPSLLGLGMTLLATTILEVCSEGATPVAADILNRASAPGNAFTFLMAGVATDYTEIMSLKETTRSWKISLFLPLVTVPQVLLISYLMNTLS